MPEDVKWRPNNFLPGISVTTYRGYSLRVEPVGGLEWDGFVDNKRLPGNDDLKATQQLTIEYADTLPIKPNASI